MNILALVEFKQAPFVGMLKSLLPQHKLIKKDTTTKYVSEAQMMIDNLAPRGYNIDAILCCDQTFLKALVKRDFGGAEIKTDKDKLLHLYAGAIFWLYPVDAVPEGKRNIPVLILPELLQLKVNKAGKFLVQRYLRKLTDAKFPCAPALTWDCYRTYLDEARIQKWHEAFASEHCILVGVDVETQMEEVSWKWEDVKYVEYDGRTVPLEGIFFETAVRTKSGKSKTKRMLAAPMMDICGYTGIFKDPKTGNLYSHTVVLDTSTMEGIEWMRKFNSVAAPKVMHNGRYDSMYFLRYNAPLHNYKFDTYMMMHAWYAELKRSLAHVSAFMLRNHMYWKDEMQVDRYEYNAKDCHVTAWACLFMLHEMPDWAKQNFQISFPKVFPCIQCGVEGMKVDPEEHKVVTKEFEARREQAESALGNVIVPHFNAGSAKQVGQLIAGLPQTRGLKGTDEKTLTKFSEIHPLFRRLTEFILEYRGANKAVSTYCEIDFFAGRLLYELDPSGTDSGRFASKASSYWCGTQVQNIPAYAKSMYVADDGYVLNAIDYSQSESRSTAYISEDENLMRTVETAKDFHTTNCSLFFGIPEPELWEMKANPDTTHLYKAIRNTGKRVNHGANYNMGARVMLETMGTRAVIEAKQLLNLPSEMKLLQVCEYLLDCFDRAYPKIKGKYYEEVKREIAETSMLRGATGWTRYCFGDPRNSKPELNSYVAHSPQSLSVMIMNDAFYKVWYELQIKRNLIRIKAQIHDEIVYQCKPELVESTGQRIKEIMEQPVTVKGRTMVIPVDIEDNCYRWIETKG